MAAYHSIDSASQPSPCGSHQEGAVKGEDLNPGREGHEIIVPINKHVARKHFKLTFRGSK